MKRAHAIWPAERTSPRLLAMAWIPGAIRTPAAISSMPRSVVERPFTARMRIV